jgi:NAD(P)-dependent dehydrogenase (short-subunit alcohol dehydrogenase family)
VTAGALLGRRAIVTAGGGAIGSATARALLADGADVLISGRTEAKLERVADALRDLASASGGSIEHQACDSLDEDGVRALVERAAQRTGRVDIAVNVVGGGGGGTSPVLRYTREMFMSTLEQNMLSAYLLLKHAGAAMVRQGGGSFVAVSSMQSHQTAPLLAAYCASKAGLEMLLKVAADELGGHGVRVNVVRPGLTRTGVASHPSSNADALAAYLEQQPIARPGEPDDIAQAIRYFAGPESSWTTGQALDVDGGCSLRRFPDLTEFWRPRFGDAMDDAARGIVD